ncbi:MAG: ABC transporter ATP-binding protein [Candidatus Methanomethylophilaceae archaeon]
MSFLEIRGIEKTYRGTSGPCLDGLELEVERGEITVILGPSGCGKSTLLRIIAGFEPLDGGTVTLDGEDLRSMSPERRPVSMVFQKPYLFPNMNVSRNISYAPRLNGTLKGTELRDETERMLELVELKGFEGRMPSQLSGGQEQRVSLARALITRPKLLLLDEPFSALDAELRVTMRNSLRRICKELDQTVIFVTHDQQEAVAIADRIALMGHGCILQYSEPNEFYHHPVSYDVAMFFGWKNAVPARQTGRTVVSGLGEFELDVPEVPERDVMLMVHPQAAMCTPRGAFAGIVLDASYLGTISTYRVDCGGVILDIQVSCRNIYAPGDMIRFNIDGSMVWPVDVPAGEDAVPTDGATGRNPFSRLKGLLFGPRRGE